MEANWQIINFYEFKPLGPADRLAHLKDELRSLLVRSGVFGTIILAEEGFNAGLCGEPGSISDFVSEAERIFESVIEPRSSFTATSPFRKQEVRIKPEIVSLRRPVDISLGAGTHVEPEDWNTIISDPEVFVLDARNDYEFRSGTFRRAVNPRTAKFSDLPRFVDDELDPTRHKRVAMFCTGGIRCEKLAPYLKARGFDTVLQLRGGILKYLETVPVVEQLWDGECFVFDERITVDPVLRPGSGIDLSQRHRKDDE